MKSNEMAVAFGFSPACVRRWSREFLPPDPRARMRTRFVKDHSPAEALAILVGGVLVQNVPFNFKDARQVVQAVVPRLLTGRGQSVDWGRLLSIRFLEISLRPGPDPYGRPEVLEYVADIDGFLCDPRFSGGVEASMVPVVMILDVGCIFLQFFRTFPRPVPGGRGQA